jgi:hypothetical protein
VKAIGKKHRKTVTNDLRSYNFSKEHSLLNESSSGWKKPNESITVSGGSGYDDLSKFNRRKVYNRSMTGDGAVSDFAMNLRCIGANRLRPTRVRQLESLNVTREANNTT